MEKVKKRELFADLLRCIAILSIIVIHMTSNYYVDSYGTKTFCFLLSISSFTSCAVPIFYMLSGCFLLDIKNSDFSIFYKKTLKIFLQTIFWSFIYILVFKFIMHQDLNIFKSFIKSLTSEQVGHLWYMYPLIGLYILTPFISKIYNALNIREKKILLAIVFFIPLLLSTIQIKFWDLITIPKFAIFFPELGLFILGRYIYEQRDKITNKKISILSFLGIIVGITLIVLLALLYIKKDGISSYKPYFDYNKIPNVLLDIALFIFAMSLNKKLMKLPSKIKKAISFVGTNTGGIYFIHMFFIYLFPDINILGIRFTANQGRLIYMIMGAMLYFSLSLVTTMIIKKIPIVKKSV